MIMADNYQRNLLAKISINSNLAQIKPRTQQIDLTQYSNYIRLEVKKDEIWVEIIALIDEDKEKSSIELNYTESNLEIT